MKNYTFKQRIDSLVNSKLNKKYPYRYANINNYRPHFAQPKESLVSLLKNNVGAIFLAQQKMDLPNLKEYAMLAGYEIEVMLWDDFINGGYFEKGIKGVLVETIYAHNIGIDNSTKVDPSQLPWD